MPLTSLMVGVTGAVFTAPVELAFRAAATNAYKFAPKDSPRLVHGIMPTPNGFVPTATVPTTFCFAVRITEISPEPPFAT